MLLLLGVAVACGATYVGSIALSGGPFVYAIDDAYIHLAVARTLAEHHVFGVTPFEPALASSSIVWPLLLAVAPYAIVPLLLNVAAALGLATVFRSAFGSAWAAAAALACVPILPLVFSGMEHTAHALAVVALGLAFARGARPWVVAALAAAAASLRFETAFVVAPMALAFVGRRDLTRAGAVAGGAALPVLLQAAATGALLPASVLLKRSPLDASTLPIVVFERLRHAPHLAALLVLLVVAWFVARQPLALVAATTVALHVVFAQLMWFYRYEAYAVALGLLAVGLAAREARSPRRLAVAVAVVACAPLAARGAGGLVAAPRACRNIHDQQLQTASFLAEAYPNDPVVVNDLGLVAWLGGGRAPIVDLMGLGSPAVARARGMRIDGPLDAAAVASLTRGAAVAAVYDAWFVGALPASWTAVARLTIAENRVCASDTVTFYALDASRAEPLANALRGFAPRLPSTVRVSFVEQANRNARACIGTDEYAGDPRCFEPRLP